MSERREMGDAGIVHPGVILHGYVQRSGVSQKEYARRLGISPAYLGDVLHGRRGISARLAILLEAQEHPTAVFWMTHQMYYDLNGERAASSAETE